ncbi:MAG: OmpA family protein [Brevundimonas sp.]|uniref:OmpA family protein n=1 Tax=Brevundimonas sp. TaxID=1871086 RepID=UPI0039197381
MRAFGARRGMVVGLACALSAMMAACGDAGPGRTGAPVGAQLTHASGAVLQILSARVGAETTEVMVRVINGRDREITLNNGNEISYLLTDSGEKLPLIAPPTNERLSIPAGQTIDGALVFAGAPTRGSDVTLVLNERGSSDSVFSSTPRFELRLPLEGAFGARGVAEVSALSGMRANPATALRPMSSEASSLGASGRGASALRVVEALKTELGAVDTERGTVVSLEGDVTFDFDRATIRPEARGTLNRLADLLGDAEGGTIQIEGHTDSRGAEDYNQDLSERRAEAVAAWLVERGVARDRLQTAGFGAGRPVAPNARSDGSDDEQGRQRNRRVEVILPDSGGAAETGSGGGQSRLEPAS